MRSNLFLEKTRNEDGRDLEVAIVTISACVPFKSRKKCWIEKSSSANGETGTGR